MARRAGLTLLVFLELTAAAVIAVALRHGRFDQGVGFYIYLLGPIAAIAVAAGFALPPEILRRASTHALLVLGCIVLSLPFVWLVSTSFKYEEEIFVQPPQWIPSTPRAVARSPYLAADERADVERPTAVSAKRWETLWPNLSDALRERGLKLLGEQRDGLSVRDPDTLDAVAAGLFTRAASGLPDAAWQADDAAIVATVARRVEKDDAEVVWDSLRRAVQLGELTLTDDDGIEHRVAAAAGAPWRTVEGDVRVVTASPPTVVYDLTNAPRATIATTLDLPFEATRLLSVRLPMRQDRSWNRLEVQLDTPAGRYVPEDSLSLGQRRWQELSFRMKHKDARDERDVGVWPLVPAAAGSQNDQPLPPGQLRLTLTIERASAVEAAGRKYANNYLQAYYASGQRWRYVRNSLYLVALSVIGQVLSCSMVAYAFARIRWPGSDALFIVLLATMMLPPQVTMVPTFVIYKHLGWYNTLKALWVPSFFGSAFFIFMLRQFMRSIPRELEEAARIDGCGYFGTYWRIILPVMKPALAAVGIFTFMGTWNDFMGPLIYINDERLYPLSLGLFDFRMQHGAAYGMLMAASTLMTLPVIVIFFVAQRYFIQGISLTGMKA